MLPVSPIILTQSILPAPASSAGPSGPRGWTGRGHTLSFATARPAELKRGCQVNRGTPSAIRTPPRAAPSSGANGFAGPSGPPPLRSGSISRGWRPGPARLAYLLQGRGRRLLGSRRRGVGLRIWERWPLPLGAGASSGVGGRRGRGGPRGDAGRGREGRPGARPAGPAIPRWWTARASPAARLTNPAGAPASRDLGRDRLPGPARRRGCGWDDAGADAASSSARAHHARACLNTSTRAGELGFGSAARAAAATSSPPRRSPGWGLGAPNKLAASAARAQPQPRPGGSAPESCARPPQGRGPCRAPPGSELVALPRPACRQQSQVFLTPRVRAGNPTAGHSPV